MTSPRKKAQRYFSDIHSAARVHGALIAVVYAVFRFPFVRPTLGLFGFRQVIVPVMIEDGRIYVNMLDPGISRQLLVDGTRERMHVAQIKGALRAGDNGIELGANIGFFTLVETAVTSPGGHVWCIEPVSDNIRMLRRTVATNKLGERARIFQYLIGDRDGQGTIQLAGASNSHTISQKQPTRGHEEVPMVTLDSFMRTENLLPKDVQFIRMDIEGYEVVALDGMKMLMEASTPLKFFIEFHPQSYPEWGWTFERFLRRLAGYGFHIQQTAKERERDSRGHETTVVLDKPTIEQLMAAQASWRPGGIQAHLERP